MGYPCVLKDGTPAVLRCCDSGQTRLLIVCDDVYVLKSYCFEEIEGRLVFGIPFEFRDIYTRVIYAIVKPPGYKLK